MKATCPNKTSASQYETKRPHFLDHHDVFVNNECSGECSLLGYKRRCVVLVRTDDSEERIASIFAEKISNLTKLFSMGG
jgi:hypothetical protein